MKKKLIIIVGQTAVGKSDLAVELAGKFSLEIINGDSQQVYKFMDIGTSKVPQPMRDTVPHHLLDIVLPSEEYNASRFVEDATAAIDDITGRGKTPLLVGGTGLYIRCLLGGIFKLGSDTKAVREKLAGKLEKNGTESLYADLKEKDPKAASKISSNDRQRLLRALEVYYASGSKISDLQESHRFGDVKYDCLKIGLKMDREELLERIRKRVDHMFDSGLTGEVETLLNKGYKGSLKPLNSIGYREAVEIISGELNLSEGKENTFRRTKNYAKRQMTWFKKDTGIKWFHPLLNRKEIEKEIENFLNL